MRLLIVNADDFGLTGGVCRAIVKGHTDGIVTSTSAIALGPAFVSGAPLLADVPALGVGVHLALVGEDPPLLGADEIPTLVDKRGKLLLSWRQFMPRAVLGRVNLDDVERELNAQLDRVTSTLGGRTLTHVDTHQHLHLWPPLGKLVARLACERGIGAVRVTRSLGRSARGRVVNGLAARFASEAGRCGLAATQTFAGFDEGGTLVTPALVHTIDSLGATGAASAELGLHPGEHGDADLARYEWGYRWGDELDALMSPTVRDAVARNGFTLGSYAALTQAAS